MSPEGVWVDGKGRGAVEIRSCGHKRLCGRIVWVRNSKEKHGCGRMLLGQVKPVGGGEWDHGWIIDPDTMSKYDVALKRLSATKLKVTGYMGSKFLSRDIIWHKAPKGLRRCDEPARNETQVARAAQPTAARVPIVYASPKSAPAPVRNPLYQQFASLEIRPPQPVPAVRPRPEGFDQMMALGAGGRVADAHLSPEARAAQELLQVSAAGETSHRSDDDQRIVSIRMCTIQAPFVSFDYPCLR